MRGNIDRNATWRSIKQDRPLLFTIGGLGALMLLVAFRSLTWHFPYLVVGLIMVELLASIGIMTIRQSSIPVRRRLFMAVVCLSIASFASVSFYGAVTFGPF